MRISDYAIKNPVVTTVTMLGLVVFGALSMWRLDTDEFPEVNPPIVTIAVPYPGASPSNVEREIVEPLEEAFNGISGVDHVDSTALDGYCNITVQFSFAKDLQEASQDIRDKISEVRQNLPPEMKEPIITRISTSDFPIVSLTLSSPDLSPEELTRIADPDVTGAIKSVPGVADVNLVGGVERELTVELKPEALQAAGVGVAQVVGALQAQNLAAPVGRVNGKFDERTIRLRGRLATPQEFERLVVGAPGGHLVRLGDVATVRDGTEEPRSVALYDQEQAVGIDIVKARGYSTTAVSDAIRHRIDEIQKTLPPKAKLTVVRDSGARVSDSVQDVESSLVEGALLTVAVVFLFLMSWRSTVITGLALPVSVLASFIAVKAFGFTLNTMSLLGLSLAIGILIDDAIVVRENIVRHMEMGKDHVKAAMDGTSEIGLAVAATTFSIVVVFVPIAFMGGLAQQWFAPFALTIACSVLVSLFVSFSLDPMLSALWPDPEIEGHGKRSIVTRVLGRFNRLFDAQIEVYKRVIGWALRHRFVTLFIAVASFAGAIAIPATGLVGSAFFPVQDRSEFNVKLETPPGSNLEYTRLKALEAVNIAKQSPEVAYTYTTIGGRGGTVDEATVYVRLVPKAQRSRHQDDVADTLRARMGRLAGVTASLMTGNMGRDKQIQVRLRGPDTAVLASLAEQVRNEARQVPGAMDVELSTRGQKPELEVALDRELAGALGISVGQVAQSLRPAFAGIDAGDWVDPRGDTRDVMVRLAPEARTHPDDLERLPLLVPGQPAPVPLGQVAKVTQTLGPAQIQHHDRERVVKVGANASGRALSAVVGDIEARVKKIALPPGYTLDQGGETESQNEVFGRILTSLAVAILLMYGILVIQFRSFLDPLPIMASLPLSLIGVMLALYFTHSTLNLMSMIGVILLMGIVAKNAILLIDFAKWAQEKGLPRHKAIIEAGGTRLRPILMTSIAIIAGMLPVAIGTGEGGDFRAPLGRAVIGGVITSTFLTLLAIPTFYDIMCSVRDRLYRLFGARPGERGQPHVAVVPTPEELTEDPEPEAAR